MKSRTIRITVVSLALVLVPSARACERRGQENDSVGASAAPSLSVHPRGIPAQQLHELRGQRVDVLLRIVERPTLRKIQR
jgi:hypothetical protein